MVEGRGWREGDGACRMAIVGKLAYKMLEKVNVHVFVVGGGAGVEVWRGVGGG